jgi:hypothetical protein
MGGFEQYRQKFSIFIKIGHYSLLAIGAYKVYEVVKAVVGAF